MTVKLGDGTAMA